MRKLLAGVGVVVLSAGVSAQTPRDQTAPGMMKDGPMTVSGCVAAGDTSGGGFKLTNAMPMGNMMDKGTMDKGTMAKDKEIGKDTTMKRDAMGDQHMMSFDLVGGENLKAHMGHKVEVMGTLSKEDRDAMGKMQGMDKAKMGNMKPMKLNVTSVKMISATCP